MADRARKKEKHRLDRLKKQRESRKLQGVSPLRRIAASNPRLECWITEGWKEMGIASVQVLATPREGPSALGLFLVDLWAVGLKDVGGTIGISRMEVMKQHEQNLGPAIVPIDPAEVRRLIAGAIRFSRQNGFKLPAKWENWVSILGPLGDLATADLADFTKDGKVLYVGEEEFLGERLADSSPREFLARPDTDYTIGFPAPASDLPDLPENSDYQADAQ